MSKIVLLFALCCLIAAVQAQSTRRPGNDRQLCQRHNAICERNERRLGRRDDLTDTFNNHCRRSNPRWRTISRCQLARATCELTLLRCSTLSCPNVERALRSTPTRPTRPSDPTGAPTRPTRPTRRTRPTRPTTEE